MLWLLNINHLLKVYIIALYQESFPDTARQRRISWPLWFDFPSSPPPFFSPSHSHCPHVCSPPPHPHLLLTIFSFSSSPESYLVIIIKGRLFVFAFPRSPFKLPFPPPVWSFSEKTNFPPGLWYFLWPFWPSMQLNATWASHTSQCNTILFHEFHIKEDTRVLRRPYKPFLILFNWHDYDEHLDTSWLS